MSKWTSHWLVGCTLLGCAMAGQAQDAQEIIEHRIAGFRDIGSAFKNLGDQLQSRQPNVAKIQMSASAINDYRAAVAGWFPPGSEPPPRQSQGWFNWICKWFSCSGAEASTGEESRARQEIWTRPQQFREAYQRFDVAAARMFAAARGGSIAMMTAEFSKLGATCKSCHEQFREEDE